VFAPNDKLDSMLRNTWQRCYCVEVFLSSVDLIMHTGRRSNCQLVHVISWLVLFIRQVVSKQH